MLSYFGYFVMSLCISLGFLLSLLVSLTCLGGEMLLGITSPIGKLGVTIVGSVAWFMGNVLVWSWIFSLCISTFDKFSDVPLVDYLNKRNKN